MTADAAAIVARAIAHTRQLLASSRVDWATARLGLEKIGRRLAAEPGAAPALDRLRDFIAEQDRVGRGR